MTTRQAKVLRDSAELIIAAVIGWFIAGWSSWWDPDAVIAYHWWVVLFGVGLLFGMFGHCRVLMIGPAVASSGLLMEILEVFHYGFSVFFLRFYAVLFFMMALVVIVGAAIGRAAKRFWIKKRLINAA